MPLKKEHLIDRQGKVYVLYAGLLALAHEQSDGRLTISTELVQIPGPENGHVAICRCEARILDASGLLVRSCTGIGDAAPDNVNRMVANALVRMSEVRAKARALRDLCNAAEAVDDLEDDPREPDGGEIAPAHGTRPAAAPSPVVKPAPAASAPAAPRVAKTVRVRYAELYTLAVQDNLRAEALHEDPASTDAQMIAEGRRLRTELDSIHGGAPPVPAPASPTAPAASQGARP